MNKKKAIKIATATAIAAGAFTAVAPTQSEASSSLASQIAAAKAAYKLPADTYLKADGLADYKEVQKQIVAAKEVRKDIIKAINNSNLSNKTKASKKKALDKIFYKHVDRARGYVATAKYAEKLQANLEAKSKKLEEGIAAKDGATILAYFKSTTDKVAEGNRKIRDDLYGGAIENRLIAEFTQATRDLLNAEYGVAAGLAEVEALVDAKDLPNALAKYNEISEALRGLDFTTALGQAIGAYGKVVSDKYDAADVLKVLSVEAISATQVQVKFNKPVDKADAEAANKVSIQGLTLTAPKLSEDGKTLTLTSTVINVKDATVAVEPIASKDNAEVKTAKYVGKLTYKDEVTPTISSVTAVTNGTAAKEIEIKLSEPVKVGFSVKVNGEYYAPVGFTDGDSTIKVAGLALDAGKTHKVELINLEDLAGNKIITTTAEFTVTVDATAPTATLTAGGNDKEILLTFSKKMDVASVTNGITDTLESVKSESLGKVSIGAVTEVAGSNGTQFRIPVSQPNIYQNTKSRTFHVVLPNTIQDALGNKLTATTLSVSLTKDEVKPVATGYKVVKEADGKVKAIEVSFSEGLNTAAAGAIQFGSVVTTNGVLDTTTFATIQSKAVVAGDKKVVFEFPTSQEIKGNYAISFVKDLVTDLSEAANKSDAFSYTIDFGQETKTEFTASVTPNGTNSYTVTFQEPVKGGAVANSATDASNYTLGGKPLPAGTAITLNGNQTIATITLPASESVAKDDVTAVFTAANIQNLAGTKTLKTYSGTVAVVDNTAPVLQSAKIIDNKTIELTYSENIQLETNSGLANSFKILQGTEVLTLASNELTGTVASGFENKLILSINKTTGGTPALPGTPAVPGVATISGPEGSKVTATDETTANATETVTYTYNATSGALESSNQDVPVTAGAFSINGVDFTSVGLVDGDSFTIAFTTNEPALPGTPAVPGTATTLDLTKAISIETLAESVKLVVDKSTAKNQHKKEVKVPVLQP